MWHLGYFPEPKSLFFKSFALDGGYYFKILYFDSWYVILVQSLIGDRGISEMIDELWEHDDCLENQFSLFSCSWKEKCQSFFSLISFSKISKMKVLKYTIVLFIHLKIWSRNWIYFFVTSSWIYLAFYSLLSFKKTLHSISQFNQVLLSTLKHCTQVVKKGVFFIEWLDLWHEWRHYWQKCQL